MDQATEKPKILLLRARAGETASTEISARWARLCKALKTFTDLEEIEVDAAEGLNLSAYLEGRDQLLLDTNLAPWGELEKNPLSKVTLICPEAFPWHSLENRLLYQKTLMRHPCLVLDGLSTTDIVRVLHLFLMPKRLAGVVPLMEKGSLIVGEKVMDRHNIGSLLDRLSAHFDKIEGLQVKARLPDLRQILSALIHEGLQRAATSTVAYPFVDFQASAGIHKLSVNMRFPKGDLSFESLVDQTLSGSNLFWNQIWMCSDALMVTYHKQHEEIEVMLLICRPEKQPNSPFKSFLYRTSERSARKENLLDAPENFTFKILSEIHARNSEQVLVSESYSENLQDIDFGSLPRNVSEKIKQLDEQCQALNESNRKKDVQLQAAIGKCQQAERDLGQKRSELLRALKTGETKAESAEMRIRDLESKVEQLKKASAESSLAKSSGAGGPGQETMVKLEAMLRAAENEKMQLRESVNYEQKRVSVLEQKYSSLYKDISLKEREINDLKAAFGKMRKDRSSQPAAPIPVTEEREKIAEKAKDMDDRDSAYKQELRKLAFKIESQEKNTRAIQAEAAEKLKMLDQKLKVAKAKEIELLKKVEDLMASLKKAVKAA